SHGQSRIIRQAYHEAPDYVPLVKRAYDLWRDLEAETSRQMLFVNGGLIIGTPESHNVRGTIKSGKLHGLPYEVLGPDEVSARFPGFRLAGDMIAVLEPNAGYLLADEGIAVMLELAAQS